MRSGGAIGQDEGVAGDGRGIKPAHLLAACRVQSRLDPGCNSQGTHHPGQSVRASNKEHNMLNHALISELEAIQQADDAAEVMLTNGRVLRGWPNAAGMRSAGVLVLGDHGKDAGELNCIVILASQVVAVGWAELTPEEYDHGKPADERDPHIVGFGLVGTEGK